MAGKFLVFTYYQVALLAYDLPYKLAAARQSGEERRREAHGADGNAMQCMECGVPSVKKPIRNHRTRKLGAGKHPSRKPAGSRSTS